VIFTATMGFVDASTEERNGYEDEEMEIDIFGSGKL
jgi:hypothetical protein